MFHALLGLVQIPRFWMETSLRSLTNLGLTHSVSLISAHLLTWSTALELASIVHYCEILLVTGHWSYCQLLYKESTKSTHFKFGHPQTSPGTRFQFGNNIQRNGKHPSMDYSYTNIFGIFVCAFKTDPSDASFLLSWGWYHYRSMKVLCRVEHVMLASGKQNLFPMQLGSVLPI